MTHNDFDFYEDLVRPLMQFLVQSNILPKIHEKEEDSDYELNKAILNKSRSTKDSSASVS